MAEALEPVEGVTLERYAEIAVALYGAKPEEVEERATRAGAPPGRITAIAEAWNERLAKHPELVRTYSDLYQAALGKAGVSPPDISLEQYAEILKRQGAGEPVPQILADFGLDLQTFAMVSQRWVDAIASDPSLVMKLAGLMGAGGLEPDGTAGGAG